MKHPNSHAAQDAEVIALKALGFLASEPERLTRFMDLSGLSLETIRAAAGTGEAGFLSGVLDHLLGDQTLLLLFAEAEGVTPDRIDQLRRHLPGAPNDF